MFGKLSYRQVAEATWKKIHEDNSIGRAAELAYYFTLALFPALIFLLSVISFMPGAQEIILGWFSTVMPKEAMGIVHGWVQSVFSNRSGGLLSFSFLFSLWAASTGVAALMQALNDAYKVKEGRPFWKAQLVTMGLTVALSLLIMGGAFLITFGEKPAEWLAELLQVEDSFVVLWRWFSYLVGFAMLLIGMAVVFYVGPNAKQKLSWIIPGALFSALAFIAVSYLFSVYLRYAPSYSITYGSLGTVIVLMIWLYLLGLLLSVGGEINAQIQDSLGARVIVKEEPAPHETQYPLRF